MGLAAYIVLTVLMFICIGAIGDSVYHYIGERRRRKRIVKQYKNKSR